MVNKRETKLHFISKNLALSSALRLVWLRRVPATQQTPAHSTNKQMSMATRMLQQEQYENSIAEMKLVSEMFNKYIPIPLNIETKLKSCREHLIFVTILSLIVSFPFLLYHLASFSNL